MNKKKLFLVLPSLARGGAERVMIHLANHIHGESFDITMIIFSATRESYTHLDTHKTKLINLKSTRVRSGIKKLIKLIRKEKPDVLLSTSVQVNLSLGMLKFLLPSGVKCIARESSIPSKRYHSWNPRLYKYYYKFAFNNFDHIICQSNAMSDDLITNFEIDRQKISVINNPVEDQKILDHRNIPPESFDVVLVANLNKQKGIDRFIKSVALVKSDIQVAILGDGPQKSALEDLSKKHGTDSNIKFLGFQADPIAYMKTAKIVALTSLYEGFPNVLLEATASGTPIIAFNVPGGTAEIINQNNGLLIENNNYEAFARGIESLIKKPLDRSIIQNEAVKKYGLQNIISQYENTLLS